MLYHKKSFRFLTLGFSVLAVSACAHPNAFPSGYTYHKQEFKSPAPGASKKVTEQQRRYMDSVQAEQFRDAVYDLLTRITTRAGMPPKPVYILQPEPMTTFYANIDNDLRESMRHIGYAIADMPEGAYVFAYDAQYIKSESDAPMIEGQPNVEITLSVFNGLGPEANQLTVESGQYYIQGAETLNIKPTNYAEMQKAK
ncbi:MAG: hypothetical protein R3D88_04175 [Alphaproteobacteria bacterium]|nr:hypothetical protein [Alphaproteobacteria bacterium]